MLGAITGFIVAILILAESDGKATSSWRVQPSVYLAIASAFTNIFLRFALNQAVTVAWWRRASRPNTTIADLHRYWSFGDSLWESITSGRHVNIIAVASILVAIVPINGPFLQRASRVRFAAIQKSSNVGVQIAPTLPEGYAGVISGRQATVSLLSSGFRKVVDASNTNEPIHINSQGCVGQCAMAIPGAGFQVNCEPTTSQYKLESIDTFTNGVEQSFVNVFSIQFVWGAKDYNYGEIIHLNIVRKAESGCIGDLQVQNCSLVPAKVNYQVVMDANRSTIELAPGTDIFDDHIEEVYDGASFRQNPISGAGTILGGFYKTLRDSYGSNASLIYTDPIAGYDYFSDGALTNRYAIVGDSGGPDCALSFADPTAELMRAVRDLAFRSAIAASNDTHVQSVTAQDTSSVAVFESQYLYLGLATLFTALAWLATFPLFVGWWHVGRTVSMSPIETAKAFRAPILQDVDSNAKAESLVKEVGNRPVRYGSITCYGSVTSQGDTQQVLGMNHPQLTDVPRRGQTFAG